MSLASVLSRNSFGLLRYISLKNRGMVFNALNESLTLVLSLSVMDFSWGLATGFIVLSLCELCAYVVLILLQSHRGH